MKPGITDLMKVHTIIAARRLNFASVERWSKKTFRRFRPLKTRSPALVSARDHYASEGIPEVLRVPDGIPAESRLSYPYLVPYYIVTGLLFKLYRRWPIRRGIPWSPDFAFNRAFPKTREGWKDVFDDREFGRMRLQGPNPFLLERRDDGSYELDYSPYFKDIFEPVVCEFELRGKDLMPTTIRVGERRFRPGEEGWDRAKIIANGLDARYCVFNLHLLETHLLIGQSFALSAFSLPKDHPLRSFLHLFTYGTLVVNDFAYKLLITPASYFIQSGFISGPDALTLFRNSMDAFSLDDLMVPIDVAKRGIDQIPDHPYVADALDTWAVFEKFSTGVVEKIYGDDAAVVADNALQSWYHALASLLPNQDVTDQPLVSRRQLVDLFCCLLYNNVVHEVCGDFSLFGETESPEHKKMINFERLKQGDFEAPAEMADVFLFHQGAYAGRFNVGGNNMMSLKLKGMTDDEELQRAVEVLQQELRDLDAELEERNRGREFKLLRMMPRKWELSISF